VNIMTPIMIWSRGGRNLAGGRGRGDQGKFSLVLRMGHLVILMIGTAGRGEDEGRSLAVI